MRALGISGLCAIPAILMPFSWMDAIHQMLGMGELPDAPIVHYLARSLSAFYAILGTLAIYVSTNIRAHRDYVRLWGVLITTFGVVMLGIDLEAGVPISWTACEGPPLMLLGAIVLWNQPAIDGASAKTQ